MVTFTSRRREPELVAPVRATPREIKYLSDIDNQCSLRFYSTIVEFFRGQPAADAQLPRRDPVVAIRSALAQALVHFYPVAGRIRELPPDGRLVVECTAEGVVFVEADVEVSLKELGEPLQPPYPCVTELVCDLDDTKVVSGKPLVFFQVTRFSCGGFAVGVHWCHDMHDGFGICKLMKAVGDLARGEPRPTVLPMWEREMLTSHAPPRDMITRRNLLGYEPLSDSAANEDVMLTTPPADMVGQYFLFGPAEISAIRSHVPARLAPYCTVFDLLAAAVWRCRTAALGYGPEQRVRFMFTSNARRGWKRDPPIQDGFYGCALVFPVVETTAAELCGSGGLGHAVELVRGAKLEVDDEYMRSTVELMARRKWPPLLVERTYVVSDITTIGEDAIDFGWGKRVGGGIPMVGDIMNKLLTYFMKCKNANGEECMVVPMYLPREAMERFAAQISAWSKNPKE
ncbi:hypothetical protein EJB05_24737, partial [Eragrostis curvula]